MSQSHPIRWRNIAFVFVLLLLAGLVIVTMYVLTFATRAAQVALAPPRIPLDRMPQDVGIAEYETVTLNTGDGVTLSGWYIPPAAEDGLVVILAHGYADNRAQLLPEARILSDRGHGVLLFDFRGHGESGSAMVTMGDHERRDLEAAIEFVAAQPGVSRIGAIGFSMGGAALAQVAAQDDRLSAVILEATYPTLKQEIRYRARVLGPLSQIPAVRVMRRAGIDVDGVRPIDVLCAISPRALLLVYGELDADVPPGTPQTMLDAACAGADLWIVAGAGHQNITKVAPDVYTTRLSDFFEKK